MRSALQRLLASPSALALLRGAITSRPCPYAYSSHASRHESPDSGIHAQSTSASTENLVFRKTYYLPKPNVSNAEQLAPEAKPGSWRNRLKTSKQYRYESDVTGPRNRKLRLIEDDQNVRDWDLWLELLRFRQRHHGPQGAIPIFIAIVQKKLELPVKGHTADEIWERLLQAGDSKGSFRDTLLEYAIKQRERTGTEWPHIYRNIISDKIRNLGFAFAWHKRLKETFPPTPAVYQQLFELSLNCGAVHLFRKIYRDHPLGPLYRHVIPSFCNLGKYETAFKWHAELAATGDRPQAFSDVKLLLTHFAQVNNDVRVEQIVKDLIQTGVEVDTPFNAFVKKGIHISREVMNRELGAVHGIVPKEFSDKFCARLFATRIFSVQAVISGLQVMGLKTIGPLSMRELISREDCNCAIISGHIDHLREAGIAPDQSKFSKVVRRAALQNQREILQSIVDCDLHPDVYEDLNLQEQLLTTYYNRGDELQVRRTLAIIMEESSYNQMDGQHWNLFLRCHIRTGNKKETVSMLERMRMMRIPFTVMTSRCLREMWLSPQNPPHRPVSSENLFLILNVMKLTLENGGFVPLVAWRAILKHLGWLGHLSEFQDLALWLTNWYTNLPPSHDLGSSLQHSLKRISESKKSHEISKTSEPLLEMDNGITLYKSVPKQSYKQSRNYLNSLFTPSALRGIIAWGFQQEARALPKRYGLGEKYPPPRQENWMWGLQLLRQLRDRGVPIRRSLVSRFLKQRLVILFGRTRVASRLANRRARSMNDERVRLGMRNSQYRAYLEVMEAIWGPDLFQGQVREKVLDLAPKGTMPLVKSGGCVSLSVV